MAKYKAEQYLYSVGWSEPDNAFVARVAEFPSMGAHGPTMEKALKELRGVLQAVLDDMEESGEVIPEPLSLREYSGKLNLRMPPDLHRELSIKAAQKGISLNQLITLKLSAE